MQFKEFDVPARQAGGLPLCHRIGPMDVANIPQSEVHCFHNVGEEPVVMFFIYDAGEVMRTFETTGEAVVHLGAANFAQPKR